LKSEIQGGSTEDCHRQQIFPTYVRVNREASRFDFAIQRVRCQRDGRACARRTSYPSGRGRCRGNWRSVSNHQGLFESLLSEAFS